MKAPYKESKKFYEHVLFLLNYVKERTGLSRKEQQNSIDENTNATLSFCPKCGKKLISDMPFCGYCGNKIY